MLWDALSADQFSAAENRAKLLHLCVLSMKLERPPYDFDAAFRSLAESTPQLLLVLSSPHFIAHRERFAQLAIKHRLPAMNTFKFYVEAGGLMSYGVDTVLPFRRAGLSRPCHTRNRQQPIQRPRLAQFLPAVRGEGGRAFRSLSRPCFQKSLWPARSSASRSTAT